MLKRIAVDAGYGYTKALADDGGRISFPSVIAPDEGDSALDEALGSRRLRERVTIAVPGQERAQYLFGVAAVASPGAMRPWAEDVSAREGYDVLVFAGIGSLLHSGMESVDVDLVLGLPLGVYGAQRNELKAALQGREAHVAVDRRAPVRVRINSVLVLPQAAGAYYAAALNRDGSVRAPEILKRPTGVVDIGFRTTDYFVMQRDDEGLRPVKALSGSLDTGVVSVYEAIRRRAQAHTGHMIDSLRIESALRQDDGILLDMGREIDLRPWLEEETANAARRISDEVRVAWGKHLGGLGSVLLAGGGAILLGRQLGRLHPGVRVMDDAVFANAAGFLAARAMTQ